MTGAKQIPISNVCSAEQNKSKEFLLNKNLLQICSTDEDESKIIIFDESSMEESGSERGQKNVKKEKDAKNEVYNERTLVNDNPVVKKPRYFNIFECGRNLLNKLDATCK